MTITKFRLSALLVLTFAAGALLTSRLMNTKDVHAANRRVYELRTYHTFPGRLPALQARFRDHTVTLFNRHHITSVGYFTPQDAPIAENTLIYILAHDNRESAKENWASFQKDPEWQAAAKASEADGKIVEKLESVFMDPTDFSALK